METLSKDNMHPIILLNYFPRLMGHGLGGIVFLSALIAQHKSISLWFCLLIFCYSLVWPNLVLAVSYFSKNPKLSETIFLIFDSVLGGIWLAYLGYSYWILAMVLSATTTGNITVGGVYCVLRGLLGFAIGALLTSAVVGFYYYPETDMRTIYLAMGVCYIFGVTMGVLTYYRYNQAKKLKLKLRDTINEVEQINRMLSDSNSSLKLNLVTDILIELLQNNVFKFHTVTLQTLSEDRAYWVFQTSIGNLSSDKKEALNKLKVDITENTFARKIYKGETHLYIPDIKTTDIPPSDSKIYELLPYKSIVLFPLKIKDRIIAILSFYSDTIIDLNATRLKKVENYINQIALVMNNTFLYEKLEKKHNELEIKNQQLNALSSHLAKYIAPQVFEKIFHDKGAMEVKSQRKKLTIFISDIVNFTAISDKVDSDVLTQLLNEYLDSMTQIALKRGGTIDKYMGDAIFVFFGDPQTDGEVEDACKCTNMALEMMASIALLNKKWKSLTTDNKLQIRMGIHSGYVSVGNFGSNFRMDYTLVGSAVKLTDTLQIMAKPNEIMVSESTYKLIKDRFDCQDSGLEIIASIEESLKIYTVIGPKLKDA